MYHELEAAYLLGDFSLLPSDKGFVVTPAANLSCAGKSGWNQQGAPFYSGGVSYTEQFTLDKVSGQYVVALGKWHGSVAKVRVNGKEAGWIDAAPWKCDVTRWLRRGTNQVEVSVIGTLKNTLGPHHGEPVLGAAWPHSFQKAPATQPPGAAYSTVAYGLFEPFSLKQTVR
jgi:hypothetical protein